MEAATTLENVTVIVGSLAALSVASERLVEIIKGIFPWLSRELPPDDPAEGWRRAALQTLAVAAGVLTAYLAKDQLVSIPESKNVSWLVLGLLASGGSGFWNAVLEYVGKVKNLKKAEAQLATIRFHAAAAEVRDSKQRS